MTDATVGVVGAGFIAVVRGDPPPSGADQDGLHALLVTEAVYRAAERGCAEPVRR